MFSFFKLYICPDYILNNPFEFMILILYANIIIYVIDFYRLMKKKSKAETMAIMLIPITASAMGGMLAGMFIYVPKPSGLSEFSMAFQERSLSMQLLLVPAAYLVLFFLSFISQKKRRKKDKIRWIASCIPDYCFTAIIFFCLMGNLSMGKNIFYDGREMLLWFFLYALYFLCCKIILLAVALLVRLFSARISVFKWHEGKSPALFLIRYFFIYQNSVLRNTMVFEFGILIPITLALYHEGFTYRSLFMVVFLYLCAVFVILFAMGPMMRLMENFRLWSKSYNVRELFCREYFIEEAIYKDEHYTVTRHFLIDEQRPAVVYYWPALKSIGNWSINTEGKSRTLYFADGSQCKFTEDEADTVKPVFAYARKIENSEISYFDTGSFDTGSTAPGKSWYYSAIQTLVIIIVMLMMFTAYNLNNIPNSPILP